MNHRSPDEVFVLRPVPAFEALTVEQLYQAHAQTVARWAFRLGGPGISVEDVVQDVFLVVHRNLRRFRGDSRITTWLYSITEKTVRAKKRRDRVRRWLGGSAGDVAGELPSFQPTPVESLEGRQARDQVYQILDGMSDKYRSVLILFELEHLSGEQIAAIKGAKLSTIWVWLHRARADFLKRAELLLGKEAP